MERPPWWPILLPADDDSDFLKSVLSPVAQESFEIVAFLCGYLESRSSRVMEPDDFEIDLEATCWGPGDPRGRDDMEIIEIGAVLVETRSLEPVDEFDSFVRPLHHPTLSDFCKKLTSIDQKDIDQAEPFPEVLKAFLVWTVNPAEVTLASWGRYDLNQLRQDCALHRVNLPFDAEHHNVKVHFANKMNCRPCGISAALKKVGLSFQGKHHRGIDDARMVVKLLQYVGL